MQKQLHGKENACAILARGLLTRLYDQKQWLRVIWQANLALKHSVKTSV